MLRINLERIIILILLVLLIFRECEGRQEPVRSSVEKIEEIQIKKDSISNPKIKNRDPQKIQVIEEPKRIIRIDNSKKEDLQKEAKTINRYLDTTRLKDAVIFSEILSEGRVLEHNFKTEIAHKTVTLKETIVKEPGGLFLSPGLNYSPMFGLEAVETSLTYIKGSWGISAGTYYDFRPGSIGLKLKIHFKL